MVDNRSKRIGFAVAIAAMILLFIAVMVLWPANRSGTLHHAEATYRAAGFGSLGFSFSEFRNSHHGKLPESIEEVVATDTKRWPVGMKDPPDLAGSRNLDRTVYLRNYRMPDGTILEWALAIYIPKEGPFPKRRNLLFDVVYVWAESKLVERDALTGYSGQCSVDAAKQKFGPDLVQQAIDKTQAVIEQLSHSRRD